MRNRIIAISLMVFVLGCSEKSESITNPTDTDVQVHAVDDGNPEGIRYIDIFLHGSRRILIAPTFTGAQIWLFDRDGMPIFIVNDFGLGARGSIGLDIEGGYFVGPKQVVGPRLPDVENATDPEDAVEKLNLLLDRIRQHGLIKGRPSSPRLAAEPPEMVVDLSAIELQR